MVFRCGGGCGGCGGGITCECTCREVFSCARHYGVPIIGQFCLGDWEGTYHGDNVVEVHVWLAWHKVPDKHIIVIIKPKPPLSQNICQLDKIRPNL